MNRQAVFGVLRFLFLIVPLIVILIGLPWAIISSIVRYVRKRKDPTAYEISPESVFLHRALVGSLGSVLCFAVFYGGMALLSLEYTASTGSDEFPGRVALGGFFLSIPVLILGFFSWIVGLAGIINLLACKSELRRSSKAVASYIFESLVPLYIAGISLYVFVQQIQWSRLFKSIADVLARL